MPILVIYRKQTLIFLYQSSLINSFNKKCLKLVVIFKLRKKSVIESVLLNGYFKVELFDFERIKIF